MRVEYCSNLYSIVHFLRCGYSWATVQCFWDPVDRWSQTSVSDSWIIWLIMLNFECARTQAPIIVFISDVVAPTYLPKIATTSSPQNKLSNGSPVSSFYWLLRSWRQLMLVTMWTYSNSIFDFDWWEPYYRLLRTVWKALAFLIKYYGLILVMTFFLLDLTLWEDAWECSRLSWGWKISSGGWVDEWRSFRDWPSCWAWFWNGPFWII